MSRNLFTHRLARRSLAPRVLVVLALLAGWWCSPPPVAHANGVPFATGDVFADVGAGQVNHFTNTGTLVDTLNDGSGSRYTAGDCWDSADNLYVTNFTAGTISEFDASGQLVAGVWTTTPDPHPESCVFDAAGDMYVGGKDRPEIYKYDRSGNLLTTYSVTPGDITVGPDWIDLERDQCTLLYTGDSALIFSYNVCTGTQNWPYIEGGLPWPCYALRILPDGEILVVCSGFVYRLSAPGRVPSIYPVGYGASFALALDPDGASFWTADYDDGTVYRVRIADGAVLATFKGMRPGDTDLGGLTVYPGPPAVTWHVTLAPASQTLSVGDVATLAATVTRNGHPAPGTTVTFTVSEGPDAGRTGTAVTDASGVATLPYSSATGGADTVAATVAAAAGRPVSSNNATVTWIAVAAPCLALAHLRQGAATLRAVALGPAHQASTVTYDNPATHDSFTVASATDPVVSCVPTPASDNMVVLALTLGAQATGAFHGGDVVLLTMGNRQGRAYGRVVDLGSGLAANPVVTFDQASSPGSVTIIGRRPALPAGNAGMPRRGSEEGP